MTVQSFILFSVLLYIFLDFYKVDSSYFIYLYGDLTYFETLKTSISSQFRR